MARCPTHRLAFGHSGEIMAFGANHLGASNGEEFLFWLGFYSPWMRFPSFLIGFSPPNSC